MVAGEHAHERKSEDYHKCTVIDLEIKIEGIT
jgi:hypothetical protein